MPGIIHKDRIISCLEEVESNIQTNNLWTALTRLFLVIESLASIDGIDSDGKKIPFPSNGFHFYTEIEDHEEKQGMIESGIMTGRKIDLFHLQKDLSLLQFILDRNPKDAEKKLLFILQQLKGNTDYYLDRGIQGDLISLLHMQKPGEKLRRCCIF